MLPNPTIILVLLVTAIGLSFGSYRYGKHVCQGEHATDVATAQNEAIAAANRDTEAATVRAVAAARAEADARVRAAGIRRKGEIDASAKARPECGRDPESMGLLLESIDHANHSTTTGNPLPDPVPATPTTD